MKFVVWFNERWILISALPITGLLRGSYEKLDVTESYKLNKFKVFLLLYFKQNMLVPSSLLLIAFIKISVAFEIIPLAFIYLDSNRLKAI